MRTLAALLLMAFAALPAAAEESRHELAVQAVEAGYARNISKAEIAAFQGKIDAMLAADGY